MGHAHHPAARDLTIVFTIRGARTQSPHVNAMSMTLSQRTSLSSDEARKAIRLGLKQTIVKLQLKTFFSKKWADARQAK